MRLEELGDCEPPIGRWAPACSQRASLPLALRALARLQPWLVTSLLELQLLDPAVSQAPLIGLLLRRFNSAATK